MYNEKEYKKQWYLLHKQELSIRAKARLREMKPEIKEKEDLFEKGLIKCIKCGKTKELNNFYKRENGKYRNECKDCLKIIRKERYETNKNKEKAQMKKYRQDNKEKLNKNSHNYYLCNKNKILKSQKEYYKNNKGIIANKRKEYERKRRKMDKIFKIKHQIRSCIWRSFQKKGFTKSKRTEKIVGCSLDFLYKYLLETFKKNYNYIYAGEEIHIDHIIPLATAKTEEDVIKLCHYTNLQLLKPEDNFKKYDKLNFELKN